MSRHPQIPAPTMYLYYVSIKNILFTNFRPVPSDGTFLATGGGRICHIVTLIWFFVPFLQIQFIVLRYEIKIGSNEETSPKNLFGMLLDKILNLTVE